MDNEIITQYKTGTCALFEKQFTGACFIVVMFCCTFSLHISYLTRVIYTNILPSTTVKNIYLLPSQESFKYLRTLASKARVFLLRCLIFFLFSCIFGVCNVLLFVQLTLYVHQTVLSFSTTVLTTKRQFVLQSCHSHTSCFPFFYLRQPFNVPVCLHVPLQDVSGYLRHLFQFECCKASSGFSLKFTSWLEHIQS